MAAGTGGPDREGLLEQLLAEGAIGEAAATAPHGVRLDRVLTAKNTLLSLITGCLFAGQGYDQVLRTAFAMPGLDPVAPGTPVPTGPALSKARAARREADQQRSDDAQHEAGHHNSDPTDAVGQAADENNEDAGEQRGGGDRNVHRTGVESEILLHVWRDVQRRLGE